MTISKNLYNKVCRTLYSIDSRLNVMVLCDYDDDGLVTFSVNWKCCGSKSPKEGKEYGECLIQASLIADNLNQLELKIDFDNPVDEDEDMKAFGYIATYMMV